MKDEEFPRLSRKEENKLYAAIPKAEGLSAYVWASGNILLLQLFIRNIAQDMTEKEALTDARKLILRFTKLVLHGTSDAEIVQFIQDTLGAPNNSVKLAFKDLQEVLSRLPADVVNDYMQQGKTKSTKGKK